MDWLVEVYVQYLHCIQWLKHELLVEEGCGQCLLGVEVKVQRRLCEGAWLPDVEVGKLSRHGNCDV